MAFGKVVSGYHVVGNIGTYSNMIHDSSGKPLKVVKIIDCGMSDYIL